jgi:hypothetical protein
MKLSFGNSDAEAHIYKIIERADKVELCDSISGKSHIFDVYDQVNHDTSKEKYYIKAYYFKSYNDGRKMATLYLFSIFGACNQWLFKTKTVDDLNIETGVGLPAISVRSLEYCHNYGGYSDKKPYEQYRKNINNILDLVRQKKEGL